MYRPDAVLVPLRDASARVSVHETANANEFTTVVNRAARWHSVMPK